MNYFAFFGLPEHYQIDMKTLISRFHALQYQCHPDRLTNSSQEEKQIAMQQSSAINRAWQVLRNPLSRAKHLLLLHGFDLSAEQYSICDTAFLSEQLILREELENIEKMKDVKKLNDFNHRIKNMFNSYFHDMKRELDNRSWRCAAEIVYKLHFFNELSNLIERLEEKLFDL